MIAVRISDEDQAATDVRQLVGGYEATDVASHYSLEQLLGRQGVEGFREKKRKENMQKRPKDNVVPRAEHSVQRTRTEEI